jgi:hypothetical protein
MNREYLKVALGAWVGVLLGLVVYQCQSTHVLNMNAWGIVAFASLGTSCGYLVANPTPKCRR